METNLLEIGKIVRPHGVKGSVKVQKYLDANFSQFNKVFIGAKLLPAEIKAVSNLNNDACALTLDIITTCEQAEKFRNMSVYIDRNDYEEFKDKLYLSDLIDKKLVSNTGDELGCLVDFDDYGASTILTSIFGASLVTNAPIMLLIPTSLTPHVTDNAMQMNNSKNIAIYAKTILFLSINLTTSL